MLPTQMPHIFHPPLWKIERFKQIFFSNLTEKEASRQSDKQNKLCLESHIRLEKVNLIQKAKCLAANRYTHPVVALRKQTATY